MNRIRKTIAVILAAVLTYGLLSGFSCTVFAAVTPVNITIDNYEAGTLDFHWTQLPGIKAAVVTYYKPDIANNGELQTVTLKQLENSSSITGLSPDYIYDINIALYDTVDEFGEPVGNSIGRGLLYYLPLITFIAAAATQPYVDLPSGGREIGDKPRLQLRWKMPRVWYSDTGKFELANEADVLLHMENALIGVYDDGRQLTSLNFRINISTDVTTLNSGSTQASLLINQAVPDYTANVSGNATTAIVSVPDANDFMSFVLWGRSNINAVVPARTLPEDNNVLPDADILPGTVYFMNVKPIFKNSSGVNVNAITSGNPEDLNGSILSGIVAYICSPIRFQLSKDAANNIYIKIYKINQGSLNLPRLYYQIQISDDPSVQGDWTIKKTMDDTYFSTDFAVTVISGINPDNEVYYKIVVKSDNLDDRMESLKMPYTLTSDISKPPFPSGVAMTNRVLDMHNETSPAPDSQTVLVKSTDVTIAWDKPANWDSIKDNLYYHFLISTSQSEIINNIPLYIDGIYWGSFPVEYRLVKYVSAISGNIKVEGNRLSYKINAFDLFKWEDDNGSITDHNIPNIESYPAFLLPNTVYYLQMYTTAEDDAGSTDPDKISDRSVTATFTTLDGVERSVPLPINLKLEANGKNILVVPPVNYVDLKFDKVTNIDWNDYTSDYDETKYSYSTQYDVYMNFRTDTVFTLIGSTDNLNGDVAFTGMDDPANTSVNARISGFTDVINIVPKFGNKLLPNTTYYFTVKTRLVIKSKTDPNADPEEKISADTSILPVTTTTLDVSVPGDDQRIPLAPADFAIALDNNDNQLLTGSSVTLSWRRMENDVVYEMIRTGQKVNSSDGYSTYGYDPEYLAFLQEYDSTSDGVADGKVYINTKPGANPPGPAGKFSYDGSTGICAYTVDKRLFPNKLYYFSLKAIRGVNESIWVSIPVTTSPINPPIMLEAVKNAELGFYWTDRTIGMTADDYKVYVKGAVDDDYKLLTRSQATIVKDGDGSTYYGRVSKLKTNSSYDIRVYRGAGFSSPVYDVKGLDTRDGYHELEVMWEGLPVDDYSKYEIAIRSEDSSEYAVLADSDLEQYKDKDGKLLPYYTEETSQTISNNFIYFHAKIKYAWFVLPGGILSRQQLMSNVKYYIKVRTIKIDPTDMAFVEYSKYAGPVNLRSEFSQNDYNNTDTEEKEKAVFIDKMYELEHCNYWRIATNSSDVSGILLKGDIVVNAINNALGDAFVIDMSAITVNIDKDEIYVPLSVIRAMNTKNKSLVIKTLGAEFTLRPRSLDVVENKQITELMNKTTVKNLYLKLTIARPYGPDTTLPKGCEQISAINDFDIQALGASKTDKELTDLFYDKLYNKNNGLVNEKLNMLLEAYIGNGTDTSKVIDEYISQLIKMIERDMSVYIDSTLKSVKLANAVQNITEFSTPVSIRLVFNDTQGMKLPYVLYDGAATWQKTNSGSVSPIGSMSFNVLKTGEYVALAVQSPISDEPDSQPANEYITLLTLKYDLSDVFTDINNTFSPDNIVTSKEVVLLYEKVTGRTAEDTGPDVRQKVVKLGLSNIISPSDVMKNIKKQETASVLLKLFAVKKGLNINSLKPRGIIYISDEESIGKYYYNQVLTIVDLGVMTINSKGNFAPRASITRAEIFEAFVRLLKLTGDM